VVVPPVLGPDDVDLVVAQVSRLQRITANCVQYTVLYQNVIERGIEISR
jgi:hypothetical protein